MCIWVRYDFPGCRRGARPRGAPAETAENTLAFHICPMWLDASPMPGWGPARDSGGGSEETFSSSLLFRHAAFGFRFLSVEEQSTENSGHAQGFWCGPVRLRFCGPADPSSPVLPSRTRGPSGKMHPAAIHSLRAGKRPSVCLGKLCGCLTV